MKFLEVLRVQVARIGLKVKVKTTWSQRTGISEGEKVMERNEMIDKMDSLTYLGSIVNKDG